MLCVKIKSLVWGTDVNWGSFFLPFNSGVDFGHAEIEHLPKPYKSTVILGEVDIALYWRALNESLHFRTGE